MSKKEDARLQGLCKECTHRNSCKDAKRHINVTHCSEYRHWKKKPVKLKITKISKHISPIDFDEAGDAE